MNTSGSGKTRLLYEGLCQHWGLYLTCVRDSSCLGDDTWSLLLQDCIPYRRGFVDHLPSSDSLAYPGILAENMRITERAVKSVLLGFLLVLRSFLRIICDSGVPLTDDHKKLWLTLQLYPKILGLSHLRIFKDVVDLVIQAPDDEILDALASTWEDVQGLCNVSADGFFVGLDEANYPARLFETAFKDEHGYHSILKQIVRSLKKSVPGVTIIVAGTDIPKEYFHGDEWSSWRWTSNTGAFDTKDIQQEYLLQFLPPYLADSESSRILLENTWKWCRYR